MLCRGILVFTAGWNLIKVSCCYFQPVIELQRLIIYVWGRSKSLFLGSISLKMVVSLKRWLRWNTKMSSSHTAQSLMGKWRTNKETRKKTVHIPQRWEHGFLVAFKIKRCVCLFIYLPTVKNLPISSMEANTRIILCDKLAHLLFVVVIKRCLIAQNTSAALDRFMLII